ncbi:restriction endonuclease subunit S [Bacteroides thetaiotaomicron]|jgi:type I restriction enzyme S subunit|uniref:restriction endonuclease subunit S n=1 Tax=Bacteroides thetaiotaomicron TaxID=818 RepID=UPI001C8CB756|nr:restriction endonuclease subunit S [Bacteroides thetaiotaomicron]MBX9074482.1 restriction endonuclease subunit S [Bacteroides thetaiotaomicron]MDC2196729.1 restriction endonuclease subunit S [Bacteroides thetaiotaomicron]UVV82678.1 restriction endonuclease subunit S [Bacteroides thetaiotaomicron]
MDTKALRQKILDLAIHGKLVPQDPNDEPASVLLERIKAEKERLIKEGKIKRSKKSAKTSDTPHYQNVPFEVPSSWVWCKLEDYVKSVTDGDHQAPPKSDIGIPFLVISDVAKGKLNFLNTRFVPQEYYEKISFDRKPEKGDLLFTVTGSYGIVVPVNIDCKFCFQRHIGLIKTLNTSEYLLHLLKSSYIKGQCDEFATGTAQKTVGLETLRSFLLPIPPFAEQQRIVIEIEKWFSLIELIEGGKDDLQTTIKQAKSKILDLAIHGKLVPQDPNDEPAIELLKRINPDFTPCDNGHSGKLPYKIPRTWVWCSHNSILDISGGSQPAKSYFETIPKPNYIRLYQIRDYGESPVPVYIPINLASKQTEKGDILLARYGGSLGKVFHAKQGAYNVAMVKVIFKFENLIYKEYAYYYYLSDLYQGKLKEISRTAQTGFNITDFNDMYFPLPPINEQQHIVQKIEELFSSLDDIQKSLEV